MKIIISPAKKMCVNTDDFEIRQLPRYINESLEIKACLQSLSYDELKKIWKCNDKIATLNNQRLSQMDLYHHLTPAILAYEGLQYQNMAPHILDYDSLNYLENHLRILSGFYGVLSPFDGITPYRLEMQAKLPINATSSLYDFWQHLPYQEVIDEDHVIVNLASKEYSKCIENYLQEKDRMINIIFGEMIEGKLKSKGTLAKIARGNMVRFMAEHKIQSPEEIKSFNEGYSFSSDLSNDSQFVFIKK